MQDKALSRIRNQAAGQIPGFGIAGAGGHDVGSARSARLPPATPFARQAGAREPAAGGDPRKRAAPGLQLSVAQVALGLLAPPLRKPGAALGARGPPLPGLCSPPPPPK